MSTITPFRTSPALGPDLNQIVRASVAGNVWYDGPKQIVSPQLGTKETGNDGHSYVFVQASAAIANAAAPGTAILITEPAMTAAPGTGTPQFNAPSSAVNTGAAIAAGDYFWARSGTL
jgi:hypothetical protein